MGDGGQLKSFFDNLMRRQAREAGAEDTMRWLEGFPQFAEPSRNPLGFLGELLMGEAGAREDAGRAAVDAFVAAERAIEGASANALRGRYAEPGSMPYDWDLTLAEAYEGAGVPSYIANPLGTVQSLGLPSVLDAVPGLSVVGDIAQVVGDVGRTLSKVGPEAISALPFAVRIQPGARQSEPLVLGEPIHTVRTGPEEIEYRSRQAEKPEGRRTFSEPIPLAQDLASEYRQSRSDILDYDINSVEQGIITGLDVDHQKLIADAFEEAIDEPNNPLVREAYEAMAEETLDQYQLMFDNGIRFELWDKGGEPYANSAEMLNDVRNNNHMYILSTEGDFGQEGITAAQRAENPLLADSGYTDVNGRPLLVNDVFRGVHDFFGHSVRGNSFGPIGEENAWAEHASMYSPLARRAMTTETRGQNSWVNFGPHMRNAETGIVLKPGDEGYLTVTERPFGEQKVTLLPEWASNPFLIPKGGQ